MTSTEIQSHDESSPFHIDLKPPMKDGSYAPALNLICRLLNVFGVDGLFDFDSKVYLCELKKDEKNFTDKFNALYPELFSMFPFLSCVSFETVGKKLALLKHLLDLFKIKYHTKRDSKSVYLRLDFEHCADDDPAGNGRVYPSALGLDSLLFQTQSSCLSEECWAGTKLYSILHVIPFVCSNDLITFKNNYNMNPSALIISVRGKHEMRTDRVLTCVRNNNTQHGIIPDILSRTYTEKYGHEMVLSYPIRSQDWHELYFNRDMFPYISDSIWEIDFMFVFHPDVRYPITDLSSPTNTIPADLLPHCRGIVCDSSCIPRQVLFISATHTVVVDRASILCIPSDIHPRIIPLPVAIQSWNEDVSVQAIVDVDDSVTPLTLSVQIESGTETKKVKTDINVEEKAGVNEDEKKTHVGFNQPMMLSDAMYVFTGWEKDSLHSRPEVTEFILKYIRENKLQDENKKTLVNPDAKLQALLGYDPKNVPEGMVTVWKADPNNTGKKIKVQEKGPLFLNYFRLQTYLKKHYISEPKVIAPAK